MSNSPLALSDKQSLGARSPYRQQLSRLDNLINRGGTLSGHERNCAFLRRPPASLGQRQPPLFATVSSVTGFDFPDDARSIALTDWDRDGDVDVWLMNRTAPRVRFLQNAQATGNRFLNLRLKGTQSNRDAIGARVSVATKSGTLTKVLRAGEGFLSQSSKEVPFGLGTSTKDRLDVSIHWPSGRHQTLEQLKTNRTYVIREGVSQPTVLPQRTTTLLASQAPVNTAGKRAESTAIFLASRIPVPRLPYLAGNEARHISVGNGRPVFVNLWASWCLPCQKELEDFDLHEKRLREMELDVVAASVDALPMAGSDSTAIQNNIESAKTMITSRDWSFPIGMAAEDLIGRLQFLEDELFAQKRNIAMPTSYLIDAEGRLAAIYRGPVKLSLLEQHVRDLRLRGKPMYDAALPFAGVWFRPHGKRTPLGMVRTMIKQKAYVDAADYLLAHQQDLSVQSGFVATAGTLGTSLTQEKQIELAVQVFRAAIKVDPNNVPIMNNLAWFLVSRPDVTAAQSTEALRWARNAATLTNHQSFPVLDTLALAQEKNGDLAGAVNTLKIAIRIAKKNGENKEVSRLTSRVQKLKP